MSKEKVTVTLDAARLAELRELVGGRSLSAGLDAALASHLDRLRHHAAVDSWLAEMEQQHGPVPAQVQKQAADEVTAWERARSDRPARRPG